MRIQVVMIGLLVLCQYSAVPPVCAEQVLHLVTLEDFAPFTWSEDGEHKGIDVDVVREVCRRSSIQCTIERVPWKRVIYYVETGERDGGFAGFITAEREKFADFLDYPIHHLDYAIFVKKDQQFQFKTLEDLYGKKIGKNRGFVINQEFETAVSTGKIAVDEANNVEQNLMKLLMGRIDGYLCDPKEAEFAAKQLNLSDDIQSIPYLLQAQRGAYFMLSKSADIENRQLLIDTMNNALKSMYDDGTMEQINAHYVH